VGKVSVDPLEEVGVISKEVEAKAAGQVGSATVVLALQELSICFAVPLWMIFEEGAHVLGNVYDVSQETRLAKFS
jgi:hypothetical protein